MCPSSSSTTAGFQTPAERAHSSPLLNFHHSAQPTSRPKCGSLFTLQSPFSKREVPSSLISSSGLTLAPMQCVTTGFVEKRFIASGKKANEKDKFYCLTEEKSPWAQVKLMGFVCLTEAVAQCSARGLQITKGSSPPKLHTMLRCIWLLSRMFTKEITQEEEQLWCMWSSNAVRFFQNSNVQMYKWQNHSGSSL